MTHPSLSALLSGPPMPEVRSEKTYERQLEALQLRMLRIQQGLFHSKGRAIVALEGFDAAGKGGAIRRMTEFLDPRSVQVVPVGPPTPEEQGRHWLYRFWRDLPVPGTLTIFDRTWYGRVLVERVEKLCERTAWKRAYGEIVAFERMLVDDGVDVVKICLGMSKDEQARRFRDRLRDPYKNWKLGDSDVRARKKWDDYVQATDDLLRRTDTRAAPWHLVPADHKWYARLQILGTVTRRLGRHADWIERRVRKPAEKHLQKQLAKLR